MLIQEDKNVSRLRDMLRWFDNMFGVGRLFDVKVKVAVNREDYEAFVNQLCPIWDRGLDDIEIRYPLNIGGKVLFIPIFVRCVEDWGDAWILFEPDREEWSGEEKEDWLALNN